MPQLTELAAIPRMVQTFRQARVERTTDDGPLTVEGWLVTYGQQNGNGYLWFPGAGQTALAQRLGAGRSLPMGFQHHAAAPLTVIGKWTEAQASREGIYGKGVVSDTQAGTDAATLLLDGAVDGISVGFREIEDGTRFLGPGDIVAHDTPYGRFEYKAEDWMLAFLDVEIYEASIVHNPADARALVERLTQSASLLAKAGRAMPGLQHTDSWDDVAYSMALLLGGRGASAFQDMDLLEHAALYQQLARAYETHGKTPPAYQRAAVYKDVAFPNDEREIFADRYLRKGLATVVASAGGFQGQLSPETREEASKALSALQALTRRTEGPSVADQLREMTGQLGAATTALQEES